MAPMGHNETLQSTTEGKQIMKYQLADLVNGQYGEEFTDKAVADQALEDAIAEGKRMNLESSGGESDLGSDGMRVEDFISLAEIPEVVSLEAWEAEFKRLSQKYFDAINWDRVVFNAGEIEQVGDDLQLDAYRNLYEGEDCNPSVSDWEFYEESCEDREDFILALKARYETETDNR